MKFQVGIIQTGWKIVATIQIPVHVIVVLVRAEGEDGLNYYGAYAMIS
jgi:hypothetical protein